jgi:hypothetical protein
VKGCREEKSIEQAGAFVLLIKRTPRGNIFALCPPRVPIIEYRRIERSRKAGTRAKAKGMKAKGMKAWPLNLNIHSFVFRLSTCLLPPCY